MKCAIFCFVSQADIILSWNAKFRLNLNKINDKKWSPKIFKILSIFRLNSEVNVFHYALDVCVFTMYRYWNILTILRGHIVVFWHSNQNILIYCILQQFIEFGVRPGTVPPPPFFYKKVSNPSNRAKYHLRSYSMRYLAKTNTFLWNNMIPALGATIQKNFWFYSKGQRKALAFSYQFNTI